MSQCLTKANCVRASSLLPKIHDNVTEHNLTVISLLKSTLTVTAIYFGIHFTVISSNVYQYINSVPEEPYYLFRSLYRNAARYVSNQIDPPLIFILLSISSQNLYKITRYIQITFHSYCKRQFINKQIEIAVLYIFCTFPISRSPTHSQNTWNAVRSALQEHTN